jgi:hypothetical protein
MTWRWRHGFLQYIHLFDISVTSQGSGRVKLSDVKLEGFQLPSLDALLALTKRLKRLGN